MSALTFTLKNPAGTADIDCGGLTADALAGKTAAEVAALPLLVGGRTAKVDDVFEVSGADAMQIVFRGSTARCHRLGAGATTGSIRVAGDADAFTLTRPGGDEPWPTHAVEDWKVSGGWIRRDTEPVAHRYHATDGEIDRAEVWQVGVDVPLAVVAFRPALPDLRRPFDGTAESAFVVDVAGQPGHGTGRVRATSGDVVTLDMIPEEPRWFADRPMRTTVWFANDGYRVKTVRTDGAAE